MDTFARRPTQERAEVIEATAARRGFGRAAVVEKDFWVCWTLHQLRDLFGEPAAAPSQGTAHSPAGLLFKGGTSLAKVYGVIQRFSEDIDLTLDRELLQLSPDLDPDSPDLSASRRARSLKIIRARGVEYIAESVVPVLRARLEAVSTGFLSEQGAGPVEVDPSDALTVHLTYPRALAAAAYGGGGYVRPAIRLEFGVRGELWPAHRATVTPYAAEEYPGLFAEPTARVNVLDLTRSFWEKATILHQLAHTRIDHDRERLSRHYYDFAQLLGAKVGVQLLDRHDLLLAVAQHKSRFFRQPSARYDLAKPGTLRLVPPPEMIPTLRRDYAAMAEMFFGPIPDLNDILGAIAEAEQRINGK